MRTLARRLDPIGVGSRARNGGIALRAACGDANTASDVLGISDRLAREWFTGHEGSPATRFFELLDSVPDASPLVTEAKIALHRRYLAMTADELVAEFFDVLDRATVAESQQIQAKLRAARSHDLQQLRDVSAAEATLDEKLAAVIDRLLDKRINPWEHQAGKRS